MCVHIYIHGCISSRRHARSSVAAPEPRAEPPDHTVLGLSGAQLGEERVGSGGNGGQVRRRCHRGSDRFRYLARISQLQRPRVHSCPRPVEGQVHGRPAWSRRQTGLHRPEELQQVRSVAHDEVLQAGFPFIHTLMWPQAHLQGLMQVRAAAMQLASACNCPFMNISCQ